VNGITVGYSTIIEGERWNRNSLGWIATFD